MRIPMSESRSTRHEPTWTLRKAVTAASLALLALVATFVLAPPSHGAPNSLLDIDDLRARVEPVPPSLQETGVTQTRLDSLLFTWLEASGVPALPPNNDSREGLLRLNVTHLFHSGWYVAQLSLEFSRTTTLASDPNTNVVATVWSRDALVMAKKKKLWGEVHDALDEILSGFVHDYRGATQSQ
jgi:hypothetical protein